MLQMVDNTVVLFPKAAVHHSADLYPNRRMKTILLSQAT